MPKYELEGAYDEHWMEQWKFNQTVNKALEQIVNRLTELEKKVSEQPTSDKTFYKPYGYDDYLSLYDSLDAIFKRLDDLEGKKRTFGKI
jgi:tetrahydromethanopterin S-methyltransferase subunit G|tara:strand:- start:2361 stop:2627 length:267 start_codon:yes stop_codon:yes gene_type:complete